MKNIILFGPPGAGKGTQAQLLKAKYGFEHISTGEVIREEIRNATPMGLDAKTYIDHGELASDELVISIITEHMEEHRDGSGNIFDGFPRTLPQAEAFDRILAAHDLSVDLMISIEVPDQMLIDRITLRANDSGRVDDNSTGIIINRLNVYKRQTAIVAGFYEKQGKYVSVSGLGSKEEVFARLCEYIDAIKK